MRCDWLLAVLALAACGNREHADPGAASASGSGSDAGAMPHVRRMTPNRVQLQAPVIEVPKQEAFIVRTTGKAPKAQLRYALPDGVIEQHVETRLKSRTLDGRKLGEPIALPAIRDGFAITLAKATPPMVRPLVATIEGSTDKPSPVAEQYLAPWRTLLQNRRADVPFDARGQLTTLAFKDDPTTRRSAAAKDELVQRLFATSVPLPEPAVGVGATWDVITVLRQGPITIKQTASYTLLARTKDAWKLHVKLLRVGEPQVVIEPSLPAGAVAELIALYRVLEGDVELDTKQPLIASGTLTVESRLHAKVRLPNQPAIEQLAEDTGTITFSSKR